MIGTLQYDFQMPVAKIGYANGECTRNNALRP